jgi:DNA-binding transcriptional MerR regulator
MVPGTRPRRVPQGGRAVTSSPPPALELPDKALFRIGEVAKLLGVQTHVIRFWQQQFGHLRPKRSSTGRFLYSRSQVEQLERIRRLLHVERLTIEGAKRALRSGTAGILLHEQGAEAIAAAAPSASDAAVVPDAASAASVHAAGSASASSQTEDVALRRRKIAALRQAAATLRASIERERERLEEGVLEPGPASRR